MNWLLVLICLTYCFTIALTYRYKEESIGLRELRIEEKSNFDLEVLDLLEENAELKTKIESLRRRA